MKRDLFLIALLAGALCGCGSDRSTIPVSPSPPPVLTLFRPDLGADGGADAG
jgi:hypothetical protein